MAIGQGFTGGLNSLGSWGNTQPFYSNAQQDPWQQAANATAQGNQYGANIATQANRVNQATPYGSLNYSQGTDQYGNPVWNANQTLSPELQGLVGGSIGQLQSSLNNPAYGVNAGETATDAIMRRLQPQLQNQQESFDVKMANQGIPVGSEAYNRAYRNFSQGQNDLLTSAQTAGINTGLAVNQAQNQTAANIKALTTPNYVNPYTQAAVAGPDYLGAAGLSNQNAIFT